MSIHQRIFDATKTLFNQRVYPDIGPDEVEKPYGTFQIIGGEPINFLDDTVSDRANALVQFNVWGETRTAVAALAAQIVPALKTDDELQIVVDSEPTDVYEEDTKLYGSVQHLIIYYPV